MSSEQKKHPASERKLQKKREEGSIAQMTNSAGLFGTAAGLGALGAVAFSLWERITASLVLSPEVLLMPFDEAREVATGRMIDAYAHVVLPVLVAVLGTVVLVLMVLNKGPVIAMKPVAPDLRKISVMAGFKRIYGKRGWVEVVTALARLALWSAFAALIGWLWLPSLFAANTCGSACLARFIRPAAFNLLAGAIVIMIVFAFLSVFVQRKLFLGEQKMTETEKKREGKDQHGSPEIRNARNRIRQENRWLDGGRITIEDTSILFASLEGVVGIVYEPPRWTLPVVTAKGRAGEKADAILADIRRLGVPVVEQSAIVATMIRRGKGDMLDVRHFQAFAQAMNSVH